MFFVAYFNLNFIGNRHIFVNYLSLSFSTASISLALSNQSEIIRTTILQLRFYMEQLTQFAINHWQLWSALIVILVVIFIHELLSQKNRAKELSTSAAVEMINHENAVVIDLRDAKAFRAGHIIDSIHASAEDFNQQRMDKYKNKPVILVCARGLQSPTLAAKLRKEGFTQPMVLTGGIAAWQTDSLPLVKGK